MKVFHMTKIDIFSGFLGAGKTTLIKKLLSEVYAGQQIVLIENEFGEIGIDGGFLKDAGVNITEMNSGCICCSLVGDVAQALRQVVDQFQPDHILIEPSGVGKLSDVRRAIENTAKDCDLEIGSLVTVADVKKIRIYMKNFGEFYNNQIESAGTIILSRTQDVDKEKLDAAIAMIREKNPDARIITTPWDQLSGQTIHDAMVQSVSLADQLLAEEKEHHHDDDDDDDECECGCHHHHDDDEEHEHHHHHDDDDEDEHEHHHHHDDDDDEDEHEHHHHHHDHDDDEEEHDHHHHDDDDDEDEHEHHHHHHHDEHGHHHHHHHHDADEIFTSWGMETPKTYTDEEIRSILKTLSDSDENSYGIILRSKGMVPREDGTWIHFDMVPEEAEIRTGSADYTGRLCVIGSKLNEAQIAGLFGV